MVDRPSASGAPPYAFEYAGGASLAVTTTTGRVALAGGGKQMLVTNPGSVQVYVEPGSSTVSATVASQCILPGTQVLMSIANIDTVTHVAAITATGAATIQISTGYGV